MAEWSQLPRELLDLISKHLQSETELLRFRSVCSTWRSSVSATHCHHPAPPRLPILPNEGISETSWGFYPGFYLSKRTIFLIGLPQSHPQTPPFPQPWLIKIEQDSLTKTHLLNPLSRSQFKPLRETFPKRLDLSKLCVSELGHEYILQFINYTPANWIRNASNLYMEKVALFSGSGIENFVLLTIHVSRKLAMFKFGEKKWTIIDDLPSPYDDVALCNGQFYAVDKTGRTVTVSLDSSPAVNLVASSVFGGDKKVLVESCGELLLVDWYMSVGPKDDDLDFYDGLEFYEKFNCYMSERTVGFRVFMLDKREKQWVEVKSLGDRMLFLGYNCTFSASASEFSGFKGNCIFFTELCFYTSKEEDGARKGRTVGVFDLESGSIGPLTYYPGYSKLFWPPPTWVSSTMLEELKRFAQAQSILSNGDVQIKQT